MPADTLTFDINRFKEAALSCPIPAAVEVIGEKWAFLILRGALNGLQHFEEFQAGLGIARNILSDRLGKMVAGDILQRSSDPSDRRRQRTGQRGLFEPTDIGRERVCRHSPLSPLTKPIKAQQRCKK